MILNNIINSWLHHSKFMSHMAEVQVNDKVWNCDDKNLSCVQISFHHPGSVENDVEGKAVVYRMK